MRMSGHQLLTVPGLDGSGFFIDLVTGQSAEMLHTEAIWGGAVYRTAMDVEAIEQVDPMTNVASTLVTAQQAALPADGNFTRLAREGDLLAWAWTSPSARGVGWRNVRTGASGAIPLPATAIPRIAVYGRYLLVVSYTSSMDPVTTTVLDTGSNATIYARTDDTSTPRPANTCGTPTSARSGWAGRPRASRPTSRLCRISIWCRATRGTPLRRHHSRRRATGPGSGSSPSPSPRVR